MSDASAYWQIEGDCGQLCCGALEGQVAPTTFAIGECFRLTSWRGAAVENVSVLALGPQEPYDYQCVDRHVRGRDFVEAFPKSSLSISTEALWRATFHRAVGASQLELIYSTRTDLLDSNPVSLIQSHVAAARVFACHDLNGEGFAELHPAEYPGIEIAAASARVNLLLFRNEQLGLSYAEMIHPSDFVKSNLFSNDWQTQFAVSELFPERMEKGVIRRARISGWFLPAENDLAVAVELARQFVQEPLPLTA